MFSDQTLIMGTPRNNIETTIDHALGLLNRISRARKAVLSADFLEDKLDALSDLVAVSTAFNALGISLETDSAEVREAARSLARC